MSEIRQIAERIKELRSIAGLTLEALAAELNLPAETYRAYESGERDIPVSLLYAIAGRFQVELTAILTGENPRLHTYCVVRKGRGPRVERRKHYDYESLAYNFQHKKLEPFLVTVAPEPEGTAVRCSTHPGQEFNYLLEGELKVVVGGHEILLAEGDALFFDASVDHGMLALKGRPARFLAVIA